MTFRLLTVKQRPFHLRKAKLTLDPKNKLKERKTHTHTVCGVSKVRLVQIRPINRHSVRLCMDMGQNPKCALWPGDQSSSTGSQGHKSAFSSPRAVSRKRQSSDGELYLKSILFPFCLLLTVGFHKELTLSCSGAVIWDARHSVRGRAGAHLQGGTGMLLLVGLQPEGSFTRGFHWF